MTLLELLSAFRGSWEPHFAWGISPEEARLRVRRSDLRTDIPPEAYIDFGDLQARVMVLTAAGLDPDDVIVSDDEAFDLFSNYFVTSYFGEAS